MPDARGLALCVARFPVADRAAIEAVRRAVADARQCVVVLRDAHAARSSRTPFTWEERAAMIRECLSEDERRRVRLVPLREVFDDERTAGQLVRIAAGAEHPAVHWAGEADPHLRELLMSQPGWAVQPDPQGTDVQDLQRRMFEAGSPAEAADALRDVLPAPVTARLPGWLAQVDHERLRAEHRQLAHEKQQWSVAPYPVTLVTVDALVRASGHVLLVRRGRAPGQGLRALPGGFLEAQDTVYESAVRELQEETLLPLGPAQARALLKGVHVFDHPRRSQRGRVITHAHYFDLGNVPLPQVRGADDAAAADWIPIAQLTSMENHFLDDHFHILDHFLGLGLPDA